VIVHEFGSGGYESRPVGESGRQYASPNGYGHATHRPTRLNAAQQKRIKSKLMR